MRLIPKARGVFQLKLDRRDLALIEKTQGLLELVWCHETDGSTRDAICGLSAVLLSIVERYGPSAKSRGTPLPAVEPEAPQEPAAPVGFLSTGSRPPESGSQPTSVVPPALRAKK